MSEYRAGVLIIDSDPLVAETLGRHIADYGYVVREANDPEAVLELLGKEAHASDQPATAVAVIDMVQPGSTGLEFIARLRKAFPHVVPVAITGYGTIEEAVQAIRQGAIDYLVKPIVAEELEAAIEKAVQKHMLLVENRRLRHTLDTRTGLENIIGNDQRMEEIYDVIQAVAPNRTTVLMNGESGTGKSLIARAIHRLSPRAQKPFVEISCGSIPETLLESELFGHVKGAFTGAHTDKPGKFLAADGGTLFLDEINSASAGMQLKLLRVLQEMTFEPVGSTTPQRVDVRVILASNQSLEELVASGEFRQDLYYRINVISIDLPPLRDRGSDILVLAEHFLQKKAVEVGKQVIGFTETAVDALSQYDYPGNVRELENIIERGVVLTRNVRIDVDDLPPHVVTGEAPVRQQSDATAAAEWYDPKMPLPLKQAMQEPEKQIILAALEANDWNRQQTAEQLEINRTTLYKKIKEYGLERYHRAG